MKNGNWWSTAGRLRIVADELEAMQKELQRLDPDPKERRLADKSRRELIEDFRKIIAQKDAKIKELEDKLSEVFVL